MTPSAAGDPPRQSLLAAAREVGLLFRDEDDGTASKGEFGYSVGDFGKRAAA